jgi:hypothetical protein
MIASRYRRKIILRNYEIDVSVTHIDFKLNIHHFRIIS